MTKYQDKAGLPIPKDKYTLEIGKEGSVLEMDCKFLKTANFVRDSENKIDLSEVDPVTQKVEN